VNLRTLEFGHGVLELSAPVGTSSDSCFAPTPRR
jgi:hypothetical protein